MNPQLRKSPPAPKSPAALKAKSDKAQKQLQQRAKWADEMKSRSDVLVKYLKHDNTQEYKRQRVAKEVKQLRAILDSIHPASSNRRSFWYGVCVATIALIGLFAIFSPVI
jgi:hypothetical protein